ncbi:MAG TPA: hypothetical protein VFP87_06515, partial [Chitinophagaceae bacterium]|nr:hypothetical protein [Chitinophagaceae bacterium]
LCSTFLWRLLNLNKVFLGGGKGSQKARAIPLVIRIARMVELHADTFEIQQYLLPNFVHN